MRDGLHVNCPARRNEGAISRIFCILMWHDDCVYCGHRNFRLVVRNPENSLTCPVAQLATQNGKMAGMKHEMPILAKDVATAQAEGLAGVDVDIHVCRLARPFYTCVSCQGEDGYDPFKRR